MPRRDLNVQINYRESLIEHENEPEEGEIVDDCELIVSSDEELCMRQRIRELEAENEEIEQIAVISRCYDDDFKPLRNNLDEHRAARIPTDASSISSTEFVTPKKRKRRKSKERKRKHCHHHHQHHHHDHQTYHRHDQQQPQQIPQYNTIKSSSHSKKTQCKRRQKIIAKKQHKLHSDRYMYKEISHDTAFINSPDSSASSSSSLSDSEEYIKNSHFSKRKDVDKNYDRFLNRDTLRLAVARRSGDARFSTKKSCLKDKLLKKDLASQATILYNNKQDLEDENDDVIEVIEPEPEIQTVDEDSSENSMEEKELRLIALKSAVIKKHMARKRRNAELAYSPTDFDGENKLQDIDVVDVVDLEENDIQTNCVIVSPEASPQLMMLDDQDDSQMMMDCKPVDMDIANSDSEDCTMVDNWSKQLLASNTTTMPTMPFSYASEEFAKQFHYNMYVHDIELPPPPPGVDDYEDIPPPPPSFRAYHYPQMQDMDLENEDFIKDEDNEGLNHHLQKENTILEETKETIGHINDKQELQEVVEEKEEEEKAEEEEEEEALRALLLSKFQSPKNQKKLQQEQEQKPIPTQDTDEKSITNVMEQQNKEPLKIKPIESILKEAVKRLKVHTQPESLNEDSYHFNEDIKWQNSKSHDGWEDPKRLKVHTQTDSLQEDSYHNYEDLKWTHTKSHDGWEEDPNDNDSISLSALRKRLTELRTQHSQVVENKLMQLEERNLDDQEQICSINNRELYEIKTEQEQMYTKINRELFEINTENIENTFEWNGEKEIPQELPIVSETNCALNTNNVDITDITRRLQEIKNKILKPSLQENSVQTNEVEVNDFDALSIKPNKEMDSNHAILKNNVQNIMDHGDNQVKELTKHKIVKADFDATKKLTTFKVTITNSEAIKPEDSLMKENENLIAKTLVKELNDENSKTTKTISNELANSQPVIKKKIVAPKTEDKIPKKTQTLLKNTSTTTATSTALPSLPSYSLIRTTKIVKPNKVINTNIDLKRKLVTQPTDVTTSKSENLRQLTKSNDKQRLITSFEQVKHMCKIPQFVINVQNSSNESSEDEWVDAYDTLYKPLYDYNDNASPLSLNLESPCLTPTRSNSPIDISNLNKDTGFEEKLDKFLKNVRTTVKIKDKTTEKNLEADNGKLQKTPLAVRHLPAAAQSEYRRLVHRMKLLQNQRKISEGETENIAKSPIDSNAKTALTEVIDKSNESEANSLNNATPLKPSLVKQVLIRNANNNNTADTQTNGSSEAQPPKYPKTNVLRSYENIYVKMGAGIVNHLDKSLKLVEEAKKAKISKLKLESRLKELKAEMDDLQSKHKEEQQKISRIYPNICSTNEIISSLKQKRAKVFKAALSLGKTLKGEEYRLNNDLKEQITTKTKKLATTIKLVNSLKAQDIQNIEDSLIKNNIKTNKDKECLKEKEIEVKEVKVKEDKKQKEEKKEEVKQKEEKKEEVKQKEESKEDIHTSKENTIIQEENIGPTKEEEASLQQNPGGNLEFQNGQTTVHQPKEVNPIEMQMANEEAAKEDCKEKPVCSYISPLEHLRNKDSNMDPNGVVCPYDLMGNCEDASCKYVHISPKANTKPVNII